MEIYLALHLISVDNHKIKSKNLRWMALTTNYVIFVGLLSICSSSLPTEKFIWNSFHACYLFFWFFLVTSLQSMILSSLCLWGDWLALHSAFEIFVHHMPVPRCHIIFFQALLFLHCCWYFFCPSLLLIFGLMFSGNSEKNLTVFLRVAVANFVCITGHLQSGIFFSHLLCMYWHWIFERSFYMFVVSF